MYFIVKCIVLYLIVSEISANETIENEIIERDKGWLKSAENVLAGPAGHVVVEVAKDLLSRSTGNSQVLTGLLGAGHWSHYGRGRSLNPTLYLEEGEGQLITGFLAAQGSGNDGCLYQAACHSPVTAYEYARAAKALLHGIDKFGGNVRDNLRYNDLIVLLEKAAFDGYRGTPCDTAYKCNI